jgi:protein involved in polysaccharide export with SLBB domain
MILRNLFKAVLFIELFFLASLSYAQIGIPSLTPSQSQPAPEPTPKARESRSRPQAFSGAQTPSQEEPAYLKPIRPEEYIVDAGDGLVVNVWGLVDFQYEVVVSADGKIVVPTVGTLEVRGKNLAEVEALVKAEMAKYYQNKNVKVSVTLGLIRHLEVSVVGEVAQPGIYMVTPVTRVSEIIEKAGGLRAGASVRNIEIRYEGQGPTPLDLARFFEEGDLTQNPVLHDRAVLYIPAITQMKNVVKVRFRELKRNEDTGRIAEIETAQVMELREGETVHDIIGRIGGISPWFDLEKAYVERFSANPGEREILPVNLSRLLTENDPSLDLPLKNGDIVTIPAIENNVYVIGRVKNAGPIPFAPNRDPFDYIGMAGGPDDRARLSGVMVHRAGRVMKATQDLTVEPGDTIDVPEKSVKWWQDYLVILTGVTSLIITWALFI